MMTRYLQKEILDLISPADDILWSSRNDPDDKRVGDIVLKSCDDYEQSEHIILGSPQDIGVERNKGRTGAEKAPGKIRSSLCKLAATENIINSGLFDLGDIIVSGSLEETHHRHEKVIASLLRDNKKVLVLGGGNDISYPDCRALSEYNRSTLALNIDSHPDVRSDTLRNSGTSYRMLLEENLIDGENFFEIGVKPFAASAAHKKYLNKNAVRLLMLDEVKSKGIENVLNGILQQNRSEVIFWGFDMDVVSVISAPGVSAPAPVGFNAEEAVSVAKIAGKDKRTKIFEISEVNPDYDIDDRTSKLAAIMIWNFLNSK